MEGTEPYVALFYGKESKRRIPSPRPGTLRAHTDPASHRFAACIAYIEDRQPDTASRSLTPWTRVEPGVGRVFDNMSVVRDYTLLAC